MKHLQLCVVGLLFSTVAFAQDGGLRFSLTDLQGSWMQGYCQGSCPVTTSWANAINVYGSITGDYVDSIGHQFCFVYYDNGRFRATHSTFTGSNFYCDARAINKVSAVAGGMEGSLISAFLHTNQDVITLFTPNGESVGYSIDDYSEVVGENDPSDGQGRSDPYRWTNGVGVNLRGAGMGRFTKAVGTSPTGSVVLLQEGNDGNVPDPGWWTLWPSDSPIVTDSCSSSHPQLLVHQMNANNRVVGKMLCNDDLWHAALWMSPGSVPINLGVAPSDAYGISSDDWVVGVSSVWSGGVGTLRVSDPNCPLTVNLNTLLDSSGAGWTVVAAYGINAAHQIVGQAMNSAGQFHAVKLTPVNNLPLCHPN